MTSDSGRGGGEVSGQEELHLMWTASTKYTIDAHAHTHTGVGVQGKTLTWPRAKAVS